MPPLPIISGRDCIVALGKLGYVVVRQKGSHVQLGCAGRARVTIPLHHELDRGTLRSILRTDGITPEEFVNLV